MKTHYEILTQKGELYDRIVVVGENEEDCQNQLDLYLSTKQDCYGQAVEDDSEAEQNREMRLLEIDIDEMTLPNIQGWLTNCTEPDAYDHVAEYLKEEYGFTENFFEKCQPWWFRIKTI